MENILFRNLMDSRRGLREKIDLTFRYPFTYYCENLEDFKENSPQIRKNPLYSRLWQGGSVHNAISKKDTNGSLIVFTNLWGNLEKVDEYFSKLYVRDNTGELEVEVFNERKYCEDWLDLNKKIDNSLKEIEISSMGLDSLYSSVMKLNALQVFESIVFKGRNPIGLSQNENSLKEIFSNINTRIGTFIGFYSLSDKNVYLKSVLSETIKRPKKVKQALEDRKMSPVLSPTFA